MVMFHSYVSLPEGIQVFSSTELMCSVTWNELNLSKDLNRLGVQNGARNGPPKCQLNLAKIVEIQLTKQTHSLTQQKVGWRLVGGFNNKQGIHQPAKGIGLAEMDNIATTWLFGCFFCFRSSKPQTRRIPMIGLKKPIRQVLVIRPYEANKSRDISHCGGPCRKRAKSKAILPCVSGWWTATFRVGTTHFLLVRAKRRVAGWVGVAGMMTLIQWFSGIIPTHSLRLVHGNSSNSLRKTHHFPSSRHRATRRLGSKAQLGRAPG